MNPIKENISKLLELDKLPEQEREDTLMKIGSIIYQNVLMRVLETMPDQEQDEFEKLLDNNASPEEVFTFLSSKVPNFEKVIEEEAIEFKNKSSNIMNQIN